jgi:hypothetical protein
MTSHSNGVDDVSEGTSESTAIAATATNPMIMLETHKLDINLPRMKSSSTVFKGCQTHQSIIPTVKKNNKQEAFVQFG